MKIGFVVNDVESEEAGFTTTRLGWEAVRQGHDVYVFGVGDVAYDPDEFVRARAAGPSGFAGCGRLPRRSAGWAGAPAAGTCRIGRPRRRPA